MNGPRIEVTPVHPDRVAMLLRAYDLHQEWVRTHGDDAGFHPEEHPEGGDYNLHNVDMDATPAAQDAFQTAVESLLNNK